MFTGASLLMTSATASNETHVRCREKKLSEKNHYIIYIPILFPMANMFQHMVFSVISTWCTWQELHDCSTVEIPCLVKALASGVDDLSRRRGYPKAPCGSTQSGFCRHLVVTKFGESISTYQFRYTKGKGKHKLNFL